MFVQYMKKKLPRAFWLIKFLLIGEMVLFGVEPNDLWGKEELEIKKIVLKGARRRRVVEYVRG